MAEKITFSVIKADVGGYVGHSSIHENLMDVARAELAGAKKKNMLIDFHVTRAGDDLELIMTHRSGADNEGIHKLAWDTFVKATEEAKRLKLYGAGQDLLSDAFSGNVKGMGPGVAEMEFEERKSEPVIVFMADKTSPGAWNLPLYKMFADPFNTAGLIIDTKMHEGFRFEVVDVLENKSIEFSCPEEIYDLLMFIGAKGRFLIRKVHRKDGEVCASASTQKLSLIAGRYVGKDDPVLVVRCQSGLPAVGEVLEPFTFPHLVEGWMRGSHRGPLMPVRFDEANPSRFDGPPRVIAAGFQIADGKLVGPRDLFDDPSFDRARATANEVADYQRAHGPFEPHRLGLDELEYTTMPKLMEKLKDRFKGE
jgi:fructose 1,6-bisphosphate aldolase/phosphatase